MEQKDKLNISEPNNPALRNNPIALSLKDSELKFRTIFDLSLDGILVARSDSRQFTDANEKICDMLGYTREELLNLRISDIHLKESLPYIIQQTDKLVRQETLFAPNLPMLKKDKTVFFADLSARLIQLNGFRLFIGIFRDINDYRKAEDKLLFIKTAVENSSDAICITDPQGRILYQNKTCFELFEYSLEELDNAGGISAVYVNRNLARKTLNTVTEGKSWSGDVEMIARSGRKFPAFLRLDVIKDGNGKIVGILGLAKDISESKKAEKLLMESEAQYRLLADHMKDTLWLMDLELKWTYITPSVEKLLGYTLYELRELSLDRLLTAASFQTSMDFYSEQLSKALTSPRTRSLGNLLEIECVCKDGRTLWIECTFSFIRDRNGKPLHILGEGREITRRKEIENALLESERNFRHSLEDSPLGVRIVTSEGETIYANKAILDIYGYDDVHELGNTPVKKRYTPESYAEYQIRMEKRSRGEAGPCEYQVSIVRKDGEIRHLHVFRKEIFWNGRKQFQIIYQDITLRRQVEEKLNTTLKNLRQSIKATIQVLGMASEAKDPYTAGHQKRVANLARAIAREMGLSGNTIEGLRMACSIHDIGKLSVPTEILTKPSKLTSLEFSMIKEHSQSGYDMLKCVDSPWPLAQIVQQHHERIDGTGYPNNLKGDDILIEARIMAVADVVEAMASHRPYRPAPGLEAALEEIERNKGILYDGMVVDSCLKLFRQKGYQLT